MFVFRKIWRGLFSWNTRFEIRPFVLLPTFRNFRQTEATTGCVLWEKFFKKFAHRKTEKHLFWSLFCLQLYQKQTPTQVFFCEYCEIFENIDFEVHLWTAASGQSVMNVKTLHKNGKLALQIENESSSNISIAGEYLPTFWRRSLKSLLNYMVRNCI